MLKGVSQIVSYVLVILIVFSGMTLILFLSIPTIERARESLILGEGIENMKLISKNIEEVVSEGIGSFRSLSLKITEGEYKVNEKTNSIEFYYSPKNYLPEPGFLKEGEILLVSGSNAIVKEFDLDKDSESEIVLENEFLSVGIIKRGSKQNYEFINTSKLIKVINFKPKNVSLIPSDTSVFIDDKEDSSYGYGYSEGLNLNKSSVKAEALIHLNTSYASYDLLYTLYAGADFLIIKVLNIRYN